RARDLGGQVADQGGGFRHQRRALDVLVEGVVALAAWAQPVDGGDAGGGGGVGVTTAAEQFFFAVAEPRLPLAGADLGGEGCGGVAALQRQAADAAGELQRRAGDVAGDRLQRRQNRLAVGVGDE